MMENVSCSMLSLQKMKRKCNCHRQRRRPLDINIEKNEVTNSTNSRHCSQPQRHCTNHHHCSSSPTTNHLISTCLKNNNHFSHEMYNDGQEYDNYLPTTTMICQKIGTGLCCNTISSYFNIYTVSKRQRSNISRIGSSRMVLFVLVIVYVTITSLPNNPILAKKSSRTTTNHWLYVSASLSEILYARSGSSSSSIVKKEELVVEKQQQLSHPSIVPSLMPTQNPTVVATQHPTTKPSTIISVTEIPTLSTTQPTIPTSNGTKSNPMPVVQQTTKKPVVIVRKPKANPTITMPIVPQQKQPTIATKPVVLRKPNSRPKITSTRSPTIVPNNNPTTSNPATPTTNTPTTTTTTTPIVDDTTNTRTIRWAASGGGWRSMFASIGFLNSFYLAGLLDIEQQTCNISGFSSNSGSSWFLIQMGYSQSFFNNAVPLLSNTNRTVAIYQFAYNWLDSFEQFIINNDDNIDETRICDVIAPREYNTVLNDYSKICSTFLAVNISWGELMYEMFRSASTSKAFNDPTFVDRIMSPTNRIPIFQKTDLYTQAAAVSVSKVLSRRDQYKLFKRIKRFSQRNHTDTIKLRQYLKGLRSNSTLTYLGPYTNNTNSTNDVNIFSVPIPMQYAVTSDGTNSKYYYALHRSLLPMSVYTSRAPRTFHFDDYNNFYLFGSHEKGNVITDLPQFAKHKYKRLPTFHEPYNGEMGTVIQVAAASSASLSDNTGAIPAFLAQRFSVTMYNIANAATTRFIEQKAKSTTLENSIKFLYSTELTTDLSVCSSWPNKCRIGDFRLVDGAITDGVSLAMNIARYQEQTPNYYNTTIKVLLTNLNFHGDRNANLLSYFSTYFNQRVKPGDFVWAPGVIFDEPQQRSPWQSMQIFNEYMNDDILENSLTPVSKLNKQYWNITTGIFHCTTLYNPAFGVYAGLNVQLLLIRLNSKIPTNLLSLSTLRNWKKPLADMTVDIATDKVLASRIREFVSSP